MFLLPAQLGAQEMHSVDWCCGLRYAGLIKAGEYPTVMETEFKRPTLLPVSV